MRLPLLIVAMCFTTASTQTVKIEKTEVSNESTENYAPGRLLLTFKKGTELYQIDDLAHQHNVKNYRELTDRYERGTYKEKEPIFLFYFNDDISSYIQEEKEHLTNNEIVCYVDYDYKYEIESYPNDTDIGYQWAIDNINLSGAWDIETGSSQTRVGIIELDGIHGYHSEIYPNINASLSYDFRNNTSYNLSNGNSVHATMVAGIIGAKGNNNYGITGVCQNVTMISYIAYYDSEIVSAITAASQNDVKILNFSQGGYSYNNSTKNAIGNYDGLFVCSAGNSGTNTDLAPHYPSCYECANIISVGNSDSNNNRFFSSNYGVTSVDVFAPGTDIYSTIPTNSFGTDSGTSYSTAYVTGICALLLSKYPCASMAKIKEALLNNVDSISSLSSYCGTGGRVNAFKTLYYSAPHAYADYYSQYNSVMHVAYCSCGASTLQPHTLGSTYMSGGMYYRNCLQCGYTKLVGGINSYENPTE